MGAWDDEVSNFTKTYIQVQAITARIKLVSSARKATALPTRINEISTGLTSRREYLNQL